MTTCPWLWSLEDYDRLTAQQRPVQLFGVVRADDSVRGCGPSPIKIGFVDWEIMFFAWMLDRDQPTVPVISVSTLDQLEQNLATGDLSFSEAERRRPDRIESYGFNQWVKRT